ncbi:MAG TPA: hypothetical protein VFB34_09825 [Chloroflexota bacterium]|nr:hypothetical protein [Chloroflexota bacterium]
MRELKTRWMYWRYRNITRNRQRLQAKWATRRRSRPAGNGPSTYRGVSAAPWPSARRTSRTWILLIAAVVAMSVVQQYSQKADVTLLADIGILAAAYVIWLQFIA